MEKREKRKRRSFSSAYKTEVVEMVRASGKSIGAVAKDLGLTETAVRAWVRQAEVDRGDGAVGVLTTAERDELTQLRRRVKTLEMEREVLKKATAFFAKESK
jgi:transposase